MNYFKYRCTFRGPGRLGVGGNTYAYGNEFVVPANEANRLVSQTYLEQGFVEPLGEVDENGVALSSNFVGYLEGIAGTTKRNYMPVSTFNVNVANAAWDFPVDSLVMGEFQPKKKMSLDKIVAKVGQRAAPDNNAGFLYIHNRGSLLVTKGDFGSGTQVTTNAYIDDNGTLTSLGLPDTGTAVDSMVYAQDTIYIGHTFKFDNVYIDMTASTNVDQAKINVVKYWNGSSWTSFENVSDTTSRSGVSLGGNGRIAWFEKPENWDRYNATASAHSTVNSGTKLTDNVYWVAITLTSAVNSYDLDADVEIERVYVPGDEVLAEVSLPTFVGGGNEQPDKFTSVVQQDGGVLTEVSAVAAPILVNWTMQAAATDQLYVGYTQPFGGIGFIIGATVNANAVAASADYWNGVEWVNLASAADSTDSPGGTSFAQDGTIIWDAPGIPSDWRKYAADSTLLTATPPATTSTEELYWVRVTVDGAVTNLFDIHQLYIVGALSVPVEVNIPENTDLQPSDKVNIYLAEDEVYQSSLAGVSLEFVGMDI